jgi:hypothetical protein
VSDERLRQLERRFRETGTDEDGAAWLGARLRAGELSEDQLRLAAHLGHGPARMAIGAEEAPPSGWPLLRGLQAFGWEAQVRACLAAARLLQPIWERQHPGDGAYARLIDAALDYVNGGGPAQLAAAIDAGTGLPTPSPLSHPFNRAARVASACGATLALPPERRAALLTDALRYAQQTAAPAALAQAVRAAVLPYALDA